MLGAVEVRDDEGRSVPALEGRHKRIAILAYLSAALPYGFHRRDKLLAQFWAHASQGKARRALNQSLLVLRSALGRDAVVSRRDTEIAINEEQVRVDVREFDAAMDAADFATAVALYNGDFLDGFYLSDALEFERWADQERTRLRHAAIRAGLAMVERYEEAGEYLAAVERARWIVRMAPLDEGVFRHYLELLDRHGDRSSALKEYTAFVERLADDYGVDPSPETQALVERIRARQGVRPGTASRDERARSPSDTERDPVLESLRHCLDGKYDVVERIGQGGMAAVYRGKDLTLKRDVAIKILRPDLAKSLEVDRFLQEVQVEAGMEHPNIVTVYDSGSADGVPYYVMPYFTGPSLRGRLQRERQLAIDEALQITKEVAAALQAAHDRGVVHRDIKPGNILFQDGRAVVADFGVARALTKAGAVRRTVTGVAIGTPGYMSPEQATADEVDERSDQYALACVLYEMLAGEMVFTGPTARAIMAKHVSAAPTPVRTLRSSVPEPMDRAIRRALEKTPADRFRSVSEFATAVARPGGARGFVERLLDVTQRRVRGAHRFRPAAILGVTLIAMVVALAIGLRGPPLTVATEPDTTRYAVVPFQYAADVGGSIRETQFLHDALQGWDGISVADPFDVRQHLATRDTIDPPLPRASRIARELGAGRFIFGSVTRVADSIRVSAALYRSSDNGALHRTVVRLSPTLAGADAAFTDLVRRLLLRLESGAAVTASYPTRSLPALQALIQGQRALEAWDLRAADSAFRRATTFDVRLAPAHLWLATVRSWRGVPTPSWSTHVRQARASASPLSPRDKQLLVALEHEARGEVESACRAWESLANAEPQEYAGWYGFARCLLADNMVVADGRSASGWSFRASYHEALAAFRRSFELHPPILHQYGEESFRLLRELLMTGGNELWAGVAEPDGQRFEAFAQWMGDTLTFVPYVPGDPALAVRPASHARAVRAQRALFREIALAWVSSDPTSAPAMESLALALSLTGDPAAVDTLRHAVSLATNAPERFRLRAAAVWMELAFAVPWDVPRVRAAGEEARRLVTQAREDDADPWLAAGLAALTGQAHVAATMYRRPRAADDVRVPPPLRRAAPALLVYSVFGGPADSIDAFADQVSLLIDATVMPEQRHRTRLEWLGRPAVLAFPVVRRPMPEDLTSRGYLLLDLSSDLVVGDTGAVIDGLRALATARRNIPPSMLTFDGLYPEAALWFALDSLEQVTEWVEPTLRSLSLKAPNVLASPERAAAFVQTMALMARAAHGVGDVAAARQWAAAVITLWQDADEFLQPVVERLRNLTR